MLILLRNLNDFYYYHMFITIKYTSLSHMEQHGFDIGALKLQEKWPQKDLESPNTNPRVYAKIDEPLSMAYDREAKV